MWTYRNSYTGATGTCTDEQRLAMMNDTALKGLIYVPLAPSAPHIPATKPVFDLPERLEETEPETLLADDAEPQKTRKNRGPQGA